MAGQSWLLVPPLPQCKGKRCCDAARWMQKRHQVCQKHLPELNSSYAQRAQHPAVWLLSVTFRPNEVLASSKAGVQKRLVLGSCCYLTKSPKITWENKACVARRAWKQPKPRGWFGLRTKKDYRNGLEDMEVVAFPQWAPAPLRLVLQGLLPEKLRRVCDGVTLF